MTEQTEDSIVEKNIESNLCDDTKVECSLSSSTNVDVSSRDVMEAEDESKQKAECAENNTEVLSDNVKEDDGSNCDEPESDSQLEENDEVVSSKNVKKYMHKENSDENVTDSENADPNDYQMELNSGYRIINEIVRQNRTTCWPFLEAVDAEGLGLWDYHQKIKEPMWLNKIIKHFENNHYNRFAEFARDFRIMVENCYRYNTTEHPISKKAKKLELTFEAKLALLKKDVRESATIAKTSNGRFATISMEHNATMRSGRVSVPYSSGAREAEADRQSRLVYDFVRCEEATLAEDERLSSYREHKQQQTLYQQVAAAFVVALESREEAKDIKSCQFLPEIGLFLHLSETTLRLPPLAMYNLEMSLVIPSDSIYLAKVMTSFLCTYYERSLINQRPAMLFKTWEKRLQQRLEKWFELVLKYNSYHCAADKLHVGVEFFQIFDWKNPFYTEDGKTKSFLELSYHEKAAIVQALCDNMTTFQSVQNNIASLACEQSRAMTLGCDADGNEYTYFPQFCGDDVRVYRHRRYGDLPDYQAPDPTFSLLPQKELINSIHNHKAAETESEAATPEPPEEQTSSNEINGDSHSEETSHEAKDYALESNGMDEADQKEMKTDSVSPSIPDYDVDEKEESSMEIDSVTDEKSKDDVVSSSTATETDLDASIDTDALSADDGSNVTETDSPKLLSSQNSTSLHSQIKKIAACQSKMKSSMKANDSENLSDSADAQWTPGKKTKKKREETTNSPLRRSRRKRTTVSYTSLLIPNDPDNPTSEAGDQDSSGSAKKRRKRTPRPKPKKKAIKIIKVIEPDEEYGSVDFELVCDNVESLRNLVAAQEIEFQNVVKSKKSKTTVSNVSSLLERLKWLLGELSAYETHFEKARFDAKIQLKREHDELLRAATTGRANQSYASDLDPWEDELISKNTVLQSDGTSVYTPPASIYYEESDEESDRELRRSKRKPKRYDSDEDFVLDSSDEAPNHVPTFTYDDFEEDRQRLIPAALEELEAKLQKQANSLQKMMGCGIITRQNEFGESSPLLTNERRTRQRSKKENKVFRKVLLLALKEKEEYGPSMLPFLKTDQVEIGEVVERVLAQEEVARQQRKQQREEEQKRKKALKEAMVQKNKAAQASRRAAKKLVNKYKIDRQESKDEVKSEASSTKPASSMWSPPKKQTIPNIRSGASNRTKLVDAGKAESVMVRMQNGKIGRALRFVDGRVVPIMRMDDAKTIHGVDSPTTSTNQQKAQTLHPHISLSSRRANILRRVDPQRRVIPPISTTATVPTFAAAANSSSIPSSSVNTAISTQTIKTVAQVVSSTCKPTFASSAPIARPSSTLAMPQAPKQSFPVFKSNLPSTTVSQRVTLPSGQVINLVVKQQLGGAADTNCHGTNMKRLLVDRLPKSKDSAKPIQIAPSTSFATPRTPTKVMTAPTTKLVLSPSLKTHHVTAPQSSSQATNFAATIPPPNLVSKPLGIVSPMPVKQPESNDAAMPKTQAEKQTTMNQNTTYLPVSQQQPTAVYPPVLASAAPRYQGIMNHQEQSTSIAVSSSQTLQLGMQNVALVTQPIYQQAPPQQVQFVPTLVAGSMPLVQPVQFVQTVPIQVNGPLMFVTPGQPQLQIGGGAGNSHRQFPTSSPSKTYPTSTPSTQ